MTKKRWELQKLVMLIQLLLSPIAGIVIVYMRDWNNLEPAQICNVTIDIVGMAILLVLFNFCVKDRTDLSCRTGYFTYLVSWNSLALFSDLICWTVDKVPGLRVINILANEVYYIVGVGMTMMFWHYLVEVSGLEGKHLERSTKILNIAGAVAFLAIVGNLFGKYYFDVDAAGVYRRAAYYQGAQAFMILMVICFVLLLTRMDLPRAKKRALFSFIAAPVVATAIQAVVYGCSLIYICAVCSLLIIYGAVFEEQNKELTRKKLEVVEKEKEILIAQQEQQRLETELNLASEIQTHILPRTFPAFPEHKEFSLYASMEPAKEVGGDFYDFFLVDEDHLALVIADVSGKGIPAALYMMIAKTMIKNAATQGMTPKQVMEIVNHQLCEGAEDVEMFVTVWLGIVEISTGRIVAVNAGHEYPAICRKGGEFELLKDKHGLVLGGMDGMRYTEYELRLEPGDTLFVYTDGVAEATDLDYELFGTDRMLRALNRAPRGEMLQLLKTVKEDIDDFVGEAEQFDDITMLAFRRNEPEV